VFAIGAECQTIHRTRVARQCPKLLPAACVPDFCGLVSAGGGLVLTIRAEGHTSHLACMAAQDLELWPTACTPDPCGLVRTWRWPRVCHQG
jgi:hypothetical protein